MRELTYADTLAELVAHRHRSGLSLCQVASAMECSAQRVARLEAGDTALTFSLLQAYARALGRCVVARVATDRAL